MITWFHSTMMAMLMTLNRVWAKVRMKMQEEAIRGRKMYYRRLREWARMKKMFIDEPGCYNLYVRLQLSDARSGYRFHKAICRILGV